MEMTDNAAGNQAGDLNAGNHRAFIRLDDDGVAFVFHAGLIEVGIQEFAGFVINSLNSTPDRAAVGVNVEHIHEGRNKNFFLTGVGILDFLNFADSSVSS